MNYSNYALQYVGIKQGSRQHKAIIDAYNTIVPLPRGYKVTYTDSWCATFASVVLTKCNAINAPVECSVFYMVQKAKQNKQIVKTPAINDLIIYDWGNNGTLDHVGIIAGISGNVLKVVEGNYNKSVGVRFINKNSNCIYCYIRVKQNDVSNTSGNNNSISTNNANVVTRVINGNFSVGNNRKKLLTNAGYDADTVQKLVNAKLKGNDIIADIINGKYGNGDKRKKAITDLGYNYEAVQAIVNETIKGGKQ